MADTVSVTNEDEFVEAIVTNDDLDITSEGAAELWRIWSERVENGSDDELLIAVASWFAESEFDKRWPVLVATIEYDDEDKGAILFDDARLLDVNVYENEIWDEMTMSETVEVIDQTEKDEYPMDEKGMIWIPRSQSTIYAHDES